MKNWRCWPIARRIEQVREQARQQLDKGLSVTAMHLALAGLPEKVGQTGGRRWVGQTAGALVEAMGEPRREFLLLRHENWVMAAGFSPDGARIVTGSWDNTVRVWDIASRAGRVVIRGHQGWVAAAAISPDGTRIVSGSEDGTVPVWNAASGAEVLVLRGHEGILWAAGFSPDGARIVSGSADNTVRVWNAASGAELLVLRGHEGIVWAAGFSADGAHIVSGSYDQTARVTWTGRSKQELIENARARLPRDLTEEERRRFYLTAE